MSAPHGTDPAVAAEAELCHRLVAGSVDFAGAFLRWVDANGCDGLPYTRLRLLETLHCQGPAMMRAVGDQLGLSPRNMTALVDALEDEGLVTRRTHPTDRRAVLLELTDEGRDVADQTLEPRVAAIAAAFDVLPEGERRQFVHTLAKMVDELRQRTRRA